LVRVGPMANALPEVIPMPDKMDIRQYTLELNGNAPLLHMGSTIYGGDGQPVGHDLLVFTPELLKQVFKSLDNSTLCLVDTTHTQKLAINPHTSQFEITPPDCLKSKANLETLKNTGRLRMRSADGPERLLFLRPLEGYDWQMLMSSEVNQLFAGVFHVIVITGLIILVLSAFSGLVILRAIGPLLQALVDQGRSDCPFVRGASPGPPGIRAYPRGRGDLGRVIQHRKGEPGIRGDRRFAAKKAVWQKPAGFS
ncbi:MAG: hypothetical protein ACOCVV_01745, partial [Marinobacter sp.]